MAQARASAIGRKRVTSCCDHIASLIVAAELMVLWNLIETAWPVRSAANSVFIDED
jgi:hypothetical protein